MDHDLLADAPDASAGENIITIASENGIRIEMTRKNHIQLEREMARTLGDPLSDLMEQITRECLALAYR